MNNLTASPVIKKQGIAKTMDFYTALKELVKNKRKITRLEWNSNDDYGYLSTDGILSIYTKNGHHRWIVNDGDLLATDWVLLPESN